MAFSIEKSIKVFDDKTGDYIYVGPDSDGLDCVELISFSAGGKAAARLFMTRE